MQHHLDEPDLTKLRKGQDAERLMREPLLQELFDGLEDAYVDAWKRAATLEAREDAHRYVQLIVRLKADLTSLAVSGQLAKRRQDELSGSKSF